MFAQNRTKGEQKQIADTSADCKRIPSGDEPHDSGKSRCKEHQRKKTAFDSDERKRIKTSLVGQIDEETQADRYGRDARRHAG